MLRQKQEFGEIGMTRLSRRALLASGTALRFGLGSAGAQPAPAPAAPAAPPPGRGPGRGPAPSIERLDPALDALIDAASPIEKIDSNSFQWCEGPVWVGGEGGYLYIPNGTGMLRVKVKARKIASRVSRE